jgi:hypothetical protein
MGYDITAYFNINQVEIENFINENNIERTSWKKCNLIIDYYKEKNPETNELEIDYIWDRKCEIHDIFSFRGTNFIRDDERLSNRQYHLLLEKKHGCSFPDCLTDINMYLRTAKDAIEIADAINIFFKEDEYLMDFANWLRITSKYSDIYELSR